MSKLFFTDTGRVLKDHNEELTRWRWARKMLTLPQSAADADSQLWILARPYARSRLPLCIHVNGKPLANIQPDKPTFCWHRIDVPASVLHQGENEVRLTCDTPAMNAWQLAIAGPTARPQSHLSFDKGTTWHNDGLGLYGVLMGEYVVRLRSRSDRLQTPVPPPVIYSDPDHPKLVELRTLLPKAITTQRDPWKQLLALRTWVATRWSHDPFGKSYCPWDAATILDWVRHERGHAGRGKLAMCVHFAVVFASFATALGHRTRCVAVTAQINSRRGHFVTEVYDAAREKWILHDANYDAHYEHGEPLSALELSRRVWDAPDKSLASHVVAGKGMPKRPARVVQAFRRNFATGQSYRLIAVWSRMDFLTNPSHAPAHHGSLVYCEPEWVWWNRGQKDTTMFPWSAPESWFESSNQGMKK